MDLGLEGRVALVLGGGGGLGRAIGVALAREGARVILAGIRQTTLDGSRGVIEAAGGKAVTLPWDLGDLASVERNVRTAETVYGPIQILINNTGGPPPTKAASVDLGLWQRNFEMMVLSVIGITDQILPGMRQAKWGRILTSTSSGVVAPVPNLGLSNALRLSLVGWSKTLAQEVAADGITTNIIVPGRIATDRVRSLDEARAKREGRSVDEIKADSIGRIPAGRYGYPEEYADMAAFLVSDRAAYVTGSVIRVDGGMISSI